MRIALLSILCFISLNASAQFWNVLKKHPVLPALPAARSLTPNSIAAVQIAKPIIRPYKLPRTAYTLEREQHQVMKTAQHNMRFRIYDQASYNFNNLAQLYVEQQRFSEAKWYFLQSNLIARQQNNDKLTLNNLCKLALVKSEIGDFMLAQEDLLEAREIAATRGWLIDVIEVEKKLIHISQKRIANLRTDIRYAEMANVN